MANSKRRHTSVETLLRLARTLSQDAELRDRFGEMDLTGGSKFARVLLGEFISPDALGRVLQEQGITPKRARKSVASDIESLSTRLDTVETTLEEILRIVDGISRTQSH